MFKRKDFFYKKAKSEGFRSRAAYKLQEIQKNFKIIRKNNKILDIGCAPGGWLQVASKYVGRDGLVIGVDILKVEPFNEPNIKIIQGDIQEINIQDEFKNLQFDVIISDIAPNLSGIRHKDVYNSYKLCMMVVNIADKILKKNGNLVVKIFQSNEANDLKKELQKRFEKVKTFKPKSSRDSSAEIYFIGLNKK